MTLPNEQDFGRFKVRDYAVDPARNIVSGPSGEIRLEPKVMSVLVMLARRRGAVVARSELIDEIWGVEHGADESLTRAISQLRKAFDDSRGEPQFIETIPKRGYRFIAPIEVIEDRSDEAPRTSLHETPRRSAAPTSKATAANLSVLDRMLTLRLPVMTVLTLTVLALAAAFWIIPRFDPQTAPVSDVAASQSPEPTLAVLPFVNMTPNGDDYFVDGLTEEITNSLATLPELMVTARTSAFYYKSKDVPVSEIAVALGVTHVVEGSVRRHGDRVRIVVQLIRASDGFHIWSNSYDRTLDDIFEIQTDISHKVAEALGVVLDDDRRAMMAAVGIRNVEAFVAYQRGLSLYDKAHLIPPRNSTLVQANAEFDAALAIEADIADAYFRQADFYSHVLHDRAVGVPSASEANIGVSTKEVLRVLREKIEYAYDHANGRAHQKVIRATQIFYSESWRGFNGLLADILTSAPVCRYARPAEEDGIHYGLANEVYKQALKQLQCDPFGLFAVDAAESALVLGRQTDALRIIQDYESAVGSTVDIPQVKLNVFLSQQDIPAAKKLFETSNYLGDRHELRIAAAAGCMAEWAPVCDDWRANLYADRIERLDYAVIAAALLGEREKANEYARRIDNEEFGAVVLHWLAKSCFCGAAFDLEATPNFAGRLKEADLPWPPPSPIEWPLKDL